MWLIFDFDGTIADSFSVFIAAVNSLSMEYGYQPIETSDFSLFKRLTIKEIFQHLDIAWYKVPSLANKIRKYMTQHMQVISLPIGMKQTLLALKEANIKLGIVTSNSVKNVELFLAQHQLSIFNFIHSEHNVFGKDKALRHVLKKFNISVNNAYYVGDEVRDIVAAKKCALKCIAVAWGFNHPDRLNAEVPTLLIQKPIELMQLT